jgi:hypothetical protein
MKLLPYRKLVIDSPLPVRTAEERLAEATGPRKLFRFGKSAYAFEGTVSTDDIRIRRVIRYQNSFLPRIHGRFEPRASRSRLVATLSLHPAVTVFMTVWFGMLALIGIPMVLLSLSQGVVGPGVLVPGGMLVFGCVLVCGGFAFEANLATERLTSILEGQVAS